MANTAQTHYRRLLHNLMAASEAVGAERLLASSSLGRGASQDTLNEAIFARATAFDNLILAMPTESELSALTDGFSVGTSGDSAAEVMCAEAGGRALAKLRTLLATL